MSEEFVFDINVPRPRFSDEQLIAALRDFSEKNEGEYFTVNQYDSWEGRTACSRTITERFGSWNEAHKKAGLDKFGQGKRYSSTQLIEYLETCWKQLGHPPSTKEFNRFTKSQGLSLSEGPYRRRWGSIRKTCQRVHDFHHGKITKEQMLEPIFARNRPVINKALPAPGIWKGWFLLRVMWKKPQKGQSKTRSRSCHTRRKGRERDSRQPTNPVFWLQSGKNGPWNLM